MNTAPLTLGSFAFAGLELPAKMPFGGAQKLAVHRLTGGGRVIDAMGADDRDVSWSGYLTGAAAVSRARQLDAMRSAGQQLTLTWADFMRTAVIASFEADYEAGGALIPYSVTLALLPSSPASASSVSAADDANQLLDDATTSNTSLLTSLVAVKGLLSASSGLTAGNPASTSIFTSIAASAALALKTQANAEQRLEAGSGGFTSGVDTLTLISSLSAAGAASTDAATSGIVAARMARVGELVS